MRDARAILDALKSRVGPADDATIAEFARRLAPLEGRYENVDAAALTEALSRRVKSVAELLALRLDDLLLAEACLDGDTGALEVLDGYLADATRSLRRRTTEAEHDELLQQLRIRLLVPQADSVPKLALYAGKGPLSGYVRVVAINLLNREQAPRPPASDSALGALPDALDWESAVLRVDQQVQFREAFRQAIGSLTVRQRAILRLNLLDGLSIDELAPLYGAHRSSVARWLAEAKVALEQQTRRKMGELLKLDEHEIDRVLSAAQSGFQLSLNRALRESVVQPAEP